MAQTHYFTRDVPTTGTDMSINKGGTAFAKFYSEQVPDKQKTQALGRPAYRTVDRVEIFIPGDHTTTVSRKVRESDKQRWPRQWEAYRKQQDFVPDGTLLDNWPLLTKGQIEDLKYNPVYTVEQLAEIPDSLLDNLGLGARRMREHAKAFLEASEKGAASMRLVDENERLKNQVSLLTSQISDLASKLELYISKSGESVADVEDPRQSVHLAAQQAAKAAISTTIEIPEDFEELPVGELRKICKDITDEKVLSKAHAVDIIKEYQESMS